MQGRKKFSGVSGGPRPPHKSPLDTNEGKCEGGRGQRGAKSARAADVMLDADALFHGGVCCAAFFCCGTADAPASSMEPRGIVALRRIKQRQTAALPAAAIPTRGKPLAVSPDGKSGRSAWCRRQAARRRRPREGRLRSSGQGGITGRPLFSIFFPGRQACDGIRKLSRATRVRAAQKLRNRG